MNREDTRKAIDVMAAWLDGQEVEFRDTQHPFDSPLGCWQGPPGIWNFARYEYRIKPEPREFWLATHGQYFLTAGEKASGKWPETDDRWIHVREVIE